MSGMKKVLENSQYGIDNETCVYKLIILFRSGFEPRLSSRSSADGYKRDAKRKRSARVVNDISD